MKKIKANLKMICLVFKFSTLYAICSVLMVGINVVSTLLDLFILERTVTLVEKAYDFESILLFIIVVIILKIILAILSSLYYGYIKARGRHMWVKKIQGIIYSKAMQIDISYFDDPELYDKFSRGLKQSDIQTINCFDSIVTLVCNFFAVVTLVIYIATKVPLLFVLTLSTSIVTFISYNRLNKIRFKTYKEVEKNNREIDYISRSFYLEKNAYDIKTTNIANLLLDKKEQSFNELNTKYNRSDRKGRKYRIIEDVVYQIVTNFVTYSYLMYEVYQGKITIGEFTSLSASIYKFINRFYTFSRNIANLKDKFMYVEDFLWLMEYKPNIEKSKIDTKDLSFEKISFQNVNFKYANKEKYALNNVSIEMKKGQRIAIIGYNGAGKTTFTKLLLKLYNPESGKILINDIDYNDLSAYEIRNKTSIILQNFQIYSATVLENVLMREKIDDNDEEIVINALKKVGLYEKIMSLPNQLNTMLTKEFSHEGVDLSGGERQKLAIARVLASKAPIAILDEPTSALDPFAEKAINDDIIASSEDKTIIIISHRLSTIVNVDKIYVMKDGVIEESGTHEELINKKGIYYTMFSAQAELYIE